MGLRAPIAEETIAGAPQAGALGVLQEQHRQGQVVVQGLEQVGGKPDVAEVDVAADGEAPERGAAGFKIDPVAPHDAGRPGDSPPQIFHELQGVWTWLRAYLAQRSAENHVASDADAVAPYRPKPAEKAG